MIFLTLTEYKKYYTLTLIFLSLLTTYKEREICLTFNADISTCKVFLCFFPVMFILILLLQDCSWIRLISTVKMACYWSTMWIYKSNFTNVNLKQKILLGCVPLNYDHSAEMNTILPQKPHFHQKVQYSTVLLRTENTDLTCVSTDDRTLTWQAGYQT